MQMRDAEVVYLQHQLHLKLFVNQTVQQKEHGPQTLPQQLLNQVLQMVPLKQIPFTATVLIGKQLELFVNLLLPTQ